MLKTMAEIQDKYDPHFNSCFIHKRNKLPVTPYGSYEVVRVLTGTQTSPLSYASRGKAMEIGDGCAQAPKVHA